MAKQMQDVSQRQSVPTLLSLPNEILDQILRNVAFVGEPVSLNLHHHEPGIASFGELAAAARELTACRHFHKVGGEMIRKNTFLLDAVANTIAHYTSGFCIEDEHARLEDNVQYLIQARDDEGDDGATWTQKMDLVSRDVLLQLKGIIKRLTVRFRIDGTRTLGEFTRHLPSFRASQYIVTCPPTNNNLFHQCDVAMDTLDHLWVSMDGHRFEQLELTFQLYTDPDGHTNVVQCSPDEGHPDGWLDAEPLPLVTDDEDSDQIEDLCDGVTHLLVAAARALENTVDPEDVVVVSATAGTPPCLGSPGQRYWNPADIIEPGLIHDSIDLIKGKSGTSIGLLVDRWVICEWPSTRGINNC